MLHSKWNQIFNNRILAALSAYGKFYGNVFALVIALLFAGNLILTSNYESVILMAHLIDAPYCTISSIARACSPLLYRPGTLCRHTLTIFRYTNYTLPSLLLKFSIQLLNHIHEYYQYGIRKTKSVLLSITNPNFS